MNTVYLQGGITRIRKRGELLAVIQQNEEEEKEHTQIISPRDLDILALAGDHSISTGAVHLIADHGGSIILFDVYGNPFGQFLPFIKSAMIQNYEKQASLDPDQKFELARIICRGSLENRKTLLKKISPSGKKNLDREMSLIDHAIHSISQTKTHDSLMGIEGSGAHAYFEGISTLLDKQWGFTGREQHPAKDPINALLSYGYGILYVRARNELIRKGLSPYYGIFHEQYRKQEALVYDFVEEFRQAVIDKVVLTLINRKMASPTDFSMNDKGGCIISSPVRKKFVSMVLERFDSFAGSSNKTYSDHLNKQSTELSQAILEGKPYIPFQYR